MVESTFTDFIKKICLYFERKQPGMEALEQWYRELQNIPEEPLPWIAKRIKGLESFPRNLPAMIKHLWSEWLDANPNKRARDKEYGCQNCDQGYIRVSRLEETLGKYYDTCFKCSYCLPLFPQTMQKATVNWLYEQGYYKPLTYLTSWKYADNLPDPDKQLPKSKPLPRKNIKTFVNEVAKSLDVPF